MHGAWLGPDIHTHPQYTQAGSGWWQRLGRSIIGKSSRHGRSTHHFEQASPFQVLFCGLGLVFKSSFSVGGDPYFFVIRWQSCNLRWWADFKDWSILQGQSKREVLASSTGFKVKVQDSSVCTRYIICKFNYNWLNVRNMIEYSSQCP